jgi:hypothetical protein
VFDTAFQFGEKYGPFVAIAVLVVVGGGIAWRVLIRVLRGT